MPAIITSQRTHNRRQAIWHKALVKCFLANSENSAKTKFQCGSPAVRLRRNRSSDRFGEGRSWFLL